MHRTTRQAERPPFRRTSPVTGLGPAPQDRDDLGVGIRSSPASTRSPESRRREPRLTRAEGPHSAGESGMSRSEKLSTPPDASRPIANAMRASRRQYVHHSPDIIVRRDPCQGRGRRGRTGLSRPARLEFHKLVGAGPAAFSKLVALHRLVPAQEAADSRAAPRWAAERQGFPALNTEFPSIKP